MDHLVTVVGYADIKNGMIAEAQKWAVKDALRNAVEQVLGVYVKSDTEVKNFELVKDEILSKAEGLIKSYDIVQENNDGKTYKVTINAKISLTEIADEVKKLLLNSKIKWVIQVLALS